MTVIEGLFYNPPSAPSVVFVTLPAARPPGAGARPASPRPQRSSEAGGRSRGLAKGGEPAG